MAARATLACLLAGLLLTACRRGEAPMPLPAGFAVRALSGERITPASMQGAPWVVNLWLPT